MNYKTPYGHYKTPYGQKCGLDTRPSEQQSIETELVDGIHRLKIFRGLANIDVVDLQKPGRYWTHIRSFAENYAGYSSEKPVNGLVLSASVPLDSQEILDETIQENRELNQIFGGNPDCIPVYQLSDAWTIVISKRTYPLLHNLQVISSKGNVLTTMGSGSLEDLIKGL